MQFCLDDLHGPEIAALLQEHLADMRRISPPESVHALDLEKLRAPGIRFWTLWREGELLGCGALRQLEPGHVEIKSMRTANAHRRQGVATAMLRHLIREARAAGITRLSLETGSMREFAPARALYAAHGFVECAPFADYREDPNSLFMSRDLDARPHTG